MNVRSYQGCPAHPRVPDARGSNRTERVNNFPHRFPYWICLKRTYSAGRAMNTEKSLKPAVFHILLALAHRSRHGYAVMQSVREQSGGRVPLQTGSFYRHLTKLIDQGLVEESPDPDPDSSESSRRGTHYGLTAEGREALVRECDYLANLVERLQHQQLVSAGRKVLSPHSSRGSTAQRAYRLLMRSYPPAYRARFGESMLHTFLLDLEGVRPKGRAVLALFWTVAVLQAIAFGLRERVALFFRSTAGAQNGAQDSLSRISAVSDASYAWRDAHTQPSLCWRLRRFAVHWPPEPRPLSLPWPMLSC